MDKIKGYRKMLGMTQSQMAKELNISTQSYRLKENENVSFNKHEMIMFRDMLRAKLFPNIKIDDIFF